LAWGLGLLSLRVVGAVGRHPSIDVAAMDAIWLPIFACKLTQLDEMFTDAVKSDAFPSLFTEGRSTASTWTCRFWTRAEVLYHHTQARKARAVSSPSGVPPTPRVRLTTLAGLAAMMAPATSLSPMNLIWAPVDSVPAAPWATAPIRR
jgi:hypothetical protein